MSINGLKRNEATGEGRKMHNEGLNDTYSSRAGHIARVGERRGVYRVLVEKHEGK